MPRHSHEVRRARAPWWRAAALALAAVLAGCGGASNMFGSGSPLVDAPAAAPAPAPQAAGNGGVKVALMLPLSAGGNAGIAGQSMRNAAEMALAEFSGANIELVTKDDGGTAPGAQQAATQAIDEGAEI